MFNSISGWIKTCASLVVVAAALGWTARAHAVIGAIDNIPSATLLLPYFDTDLGDANGAQTTLRLGNSSATAVLSHVTLWTDLGVPTLQFNVYLTGYDSVDMDLRLLFQGIVPQTASAGQDPTDTISPKGQLSQDINFASCSGGTLPAPGLPPTASNALPLNTTWNSTTLAAIRAAHVGQASTLWSGQCGAAMHGDNIARGYITFDTVNSCTQRYPTDAGYLASGGTGDATNQNVMYGSFTRSNRNQNTTTTANLVNIEASAVDTQTTTSGRPTFYSRAVSNTAVDNREALGAVWQVRNVSGGTFPGGTQLIVWRDPGVIVAPFTCGTLPAPFPLAFEQVVGFDEAEHFTVTSNTHALPYATQVVDAATLTPYASGFIHLDLDAPSGTATQSFVSAVSLNPGHFAAAAPAHLLLTQSQVACNATVGCVQTFQPQYYPTIIN